MSKLTGTLDPEIIVEAVRAATEEVLTTMLGMEIRACSWSGTGSIHCSASFACQLCSQCLMTEFHSADEEVLDAVAELANMIIGNFKNLAEADLGPLMLSIPIVVFGRNFPTREPTHGMRSVASQLHPLNS